MRAASSDEKGGHAGCWLAAVARGVEDLADLEPRVRARGGERDQRAGDETEREWRLAKDEQREVDVARLVGEVGTRERRGG